MFHPLRQNIQPDSRKKHTYPDGAFSFPCASNTIIRRAF